MPPYSLPCALRSRRSASGSPARASNRPACASASASRASVSVSRCLAQKAPSMWSTGMSYWIDRIKRRQDESKTPAQPLHRQARHMKSARHVSHVGPMPRRRACASHPRQNEIDAKRTPKPSRNFWGLINGVSIQSLIFVFETAVTHRRLSIKPDIFTTGCVPISFADAAGEVFCFCRGRRGSSEAPPALPCTCRASARFHRP